VRVLQNCLERAVILSDGETIFAKHLNLSGEELSRVEDPFAALDLTGSLADITGRAVAEVERRAIKQALTETNGDAPRAADRLQIGYKVLTSKMKALGI
jgi:DNA-binding NtrC family response regulator